MGNHNISRTVVVKAEFTAAGKRVYHERYGGMLGVLGQRELAVDPLIRCGRDVKWNASSCLDDSIQ